MISRFRPLWLLLAAVLVPSSVKADDVRPVQVQVREQEPGTFLVHWQVPQVLPPQAMPSPVLPDSCVREGARDVRDRSGAWLNRQMYRCPSGIAGQSIGIDYPFGNPSLSTVIRVELLSGEQHATLLAPGEDSWHLPPGDAIDAPLLAAQSGVLAGVAHVFDHWVHFAFLAAVGLLGAVPLTTRFAGGQLVAVLLAAVGLRIGLSLGNLGMALGELGMALGALFLASEALRPKEERRQLAGLAAATGVVHGLGMASLAESSMSLLLAVLGMDVAFLALGFALARLLVWRAGLRRVAAYAAGASAVALGLGILTAGPTVDARQRSTAPLPSLSGGASAAGQSSRRVSPQAPDAAFQSFVAIEAFEVRHEILVRLQDVAPALGLDAAESIEIEEQGNVKERIAGLVTASYLLEIDGVANEGILERIDFMTIDAQGVLPRPAPVRESVSEAFVGVTSIHVTPSTPEDVTLTWRSFEMVTQIPATVTDPEVSQATLLTADEPSLRWVNELAENPVSSVVAITVEPTRLPIPLLSLPFLAIALVFLVGGVRRSRSPHSLVIARVSVAVALVVGPLGDVAVALPVSPAPTEAQARRILAGVLPNVYRAFELREESAAYDRLSVSVTGETLTEIYLEHRRALEMEERGGARARVEAVEVSGVSEVLPEPNGGFDAEASWSVGGTVTHFGHRHFRQNRYQARVIMVPVDDFWKIRSIDILDEERVR